MPDSETKDTASPPPMKSKWGFNFVNEIIIFALTIWYAYSLCHYVVGRINSLGLLAWCVFLELPAIIVAAVCFVRVITRLCKSWKQLDKRVCITRLAIIVGLVANIFIGITFIKPWKAHTYGLRTYLSHKVDIQAIQRWLTTAEITQDRHDIDSNSLPPFIKVLNPYHVYIQPNYKSSIGKEVAIVWGGGMAGHWGLIVGSKEMEMTYPISDVDPVSFALPFCPGAYVFIHE